MSDERDLVAILKAALAPVEVCWGYAPLDTMNEPPPLPLVVVQRLSFATAAFEDMCEGPYVGDTIIAVDAWAIYYEAGRTLCTDIREATTALGGWRLQSETDFYDPTVRAWRIQGQWLAVGVPPT
jgi:hypothetical protein